MSRTVCITVNYNGLDDTVRCIESLLQLSDPPHIVVVDNGSSEKGTVEKLSGIHGIKFIALGENFGFGRANNIGIRWAFENLDCEFVFLLNNDATVKPDTLSHLELLLDKNGAAGIATPRIVFADNPTVLWCGRGNIDFGIGSVILPGHMGLADAPQAMLEGDTEFACGCAMLIRRSVLEQVGGFDPRFFMYEEDVELSIRVRNTGWKIWYVPQAIVAHRSQGSLRKKEERNIGRFNPRNPHLAFYLYHTILNRLLNMSIHARGINALNFLVVFPMYWFPRLIIYVLHGKWVAVVAIKNGVQDYFASRKQPFVNELCCAQRGISPESGR